MKRICNIENCNNKYKAKGYCNKHYQRFLKNGNPLIAKFYPIINHSDFCEVEGCNGEYYGKGYCNKHWQRLRKYGNLEITKKKCKNCDAPYFCHDLCYKCFCKSDYVKNYSAKRREIYKNNKIDLEMWKNLKEFFDYCCAYCGKYCGDKITMDHMIPLSLGGKHSNDNLLPSCMSCNSSKKDKLLRDWFPGYREFEDKVLNAI